MPGEEIKRYIPFLHLGEEDLRPSLAAADRRTAYLKLREAALQMLRSDLKEVEELCLCPAPAALIFRVVCVEVGLVPDLPVFYTEIHAFSPAVIDVPDDMLADPCPFVKVGGRDRPVLFYRMLNALTEPVKHMSSGLLYAGEVFVGVHEIIRGGVVLIGFEILKDTGDVDGVGATVVVAVSAVVSPRVGDPERRVCVDVVRYLVFLNSLRAVVYRVHRFDWSALIGEIDLDFAHIRSTFRRI